LTVSLSPSRKWARITDAQTGRVPENDHKLRAARVEHVPGKRDDFYVYLIEG